MYDLFWNMYERSAAKADLVSVKKRHPAAAIVSVSLLIYDTGVMTLLFACLFIFHITGYYLMFCSDEHAHTISAVKVFLSTI